MNLLDVQPLMLDHRTIQDYRFALLDPAQVDRDAWQDLPGESVVPSEYAGQSHLFPVLIELEKMSFSSRIGLLDRMDAWQRRRESPLFNALIDSTHGAEALRSHLAGRMSVQRPDGENDLLRFHDPRVFRQLRWLLEPSQMSQLLGPLSRWAWREPHGDWLSYTNPDAESFVRRRHWRLDVGQWDSLQRFGEITQALTTLTRKAPDLPDNAELAQRLDALLAEAWVRHRMAERDDRQLYAEQAIRFGAGIHRHPDLQERLRQTGDETTTYIGACADLDDAAMRRMAKELANIKERA